MISEKINELRGLGTTRANAMRQISEQFPEKLISFNENQELQAYARNLEIEKEKHLKRQENEASKSVKDMEQRKEAIKVANLIMIKRGFRNPKNQKAAEKYAEKKEQKANRPLTEKDIKELKIKMAGKSH